MFLLSKLSPAVAGRGSPSPGLGAACLRRRGARSLRPAGRGPRPTSCWIPSRRGAAIQAPTAGLPLVELRLGELRLELALLRASPRSGPRVGPMCFGGDADHRSTGRTVDRGTDGPLGRGRWLTERREGAPASAAAGCAGPVRGSRGSARPRAGPPVPGRGRWRRHPGRSHGPLPHRRGVLQAAAAMRTRRVPWASRSSSPACPSGSRTGTRWRSHGASSCPGIAAAAAERLADQGVARVHARVAAAPTLPGMGGTGRGRALPREPRTGPAHPAAALAGAPSRRSVSQRPLPSGPSVPRLDRAPGGTAGSALPPKRRIARLEGQIEELRSQQEPAPPAARPGAARRVAGPRRGPGGTAAPRLDGGRRPGGCPDATAAQPVGRGPRPARRERPRPRRASEARCVRAWRRRSVTCDRRSWTAGTSSPPEACAGVGNPTRRRAGECFRAGRLSRVTRHDP